MAVELCEVEAVRGRQGKLVRHSMCCFCQHHQRRDERGMPNNALLLGLLCLRANFACGADVAAPFPSA